MATKIYLPSSGAAPVTPSTWIFTNQINPLTFKGDITKISSALTTKLEATGTTSPITKAMLRYVIGPLTAQSISGTVRMVMKGLESNAGANANLAMAVKIIQPGGADRAVLLAVTSSDSAASPYEFTTSLATLRCWSLTETEPLTLTTQSALDGDYLVIEIGFRSATTTSRNISLRYGDAAATDFAYLDGLTTDLNAWVEFSGNISFQLPAITGTLSVTLDDLGSSLVGTVDVSGSFDNSLDDLSYSLAGSVDVAGVLSQVLEDLGLSATGTVGSAGITGTLDLTLEDIALTASGSVDLVGVLVQTLADLGLTGAGSIDVAGVLSQVLENLGLSSAGSVDLAGLLVQTLESLGLVAAGSVNVAGALVQTLEDLGLVATGTVIDANAINGSLNETLAGLGIDAAGSVAVAGELVQTLADLGLDAVGSVDVAGVFVETLSSLDLIAFGTVTDQVLVEATLELTIESRSLALTLNKNIDLELIDRSLFLTKRN